MRFNEVRWNAVRQYLHDAGDHLEVIMQDPDTQPTEGKLAVRVRLAVELAVERMDEMGT